MRRAGCLVLCGFLLSSCSSIHYGEEAACDAPPDPGIPVRAPGNDGLRLISWNLHGPPEVGPMQPRIDRIAGQVRARAPDVALFQEVWFEGDAILLERTLGARYERVRDDETVRSHLFSRFTGFRAGGLLAFVATRSQWKADGGSQFERFRESGPWFRLRERDGIAGKGVQYFMLVNNGQRVAILNTHLQAQQAGLAREARYRRIRSAQITQLRELAERLGDGKLHVVLAGDLNTMPQEAELYRSLTAYWTDVTRAMYDACRCGTHLSMVLDDGTRAYGDRWLDYVLLRPAPGAGAAGATVELIRSETRDCRYSDHHGLDVLLPISSR